MNQPTQNIKLCFKPKIKSPQGNHGDRDADWLVVCEISLNPHGLRINPDHNVRISFPRGPSCPRAYGEIFRLWREY